jgi:hypothetical protein
MCHFLTTQFSPPPNPTSRLEPNRRRAVLRAPNLTSIDIHAHYYPESYLNAIGEIGKRFGGDYRVTETGPYVTTPLAGGAGQLARKFTDLKLRIADIDAQGIAMQAISLTAPMVRVAAQDGAGWPGGAHSEAMTAAAEVTIVCSGV